MGERVTRTRGWVFFCNNQTQEENLRRGVVGTYADNLPRFQDLRAGDPVLLYNYHTRQLVAHFTATSETRIVDDSDPWSRKYPAQVSVKLDALFEEPIPKWKLQQIPDLTFSKRGYLTNFSLPIELVQEILDMAYGRKGKPGDIVSPAEQGFRRKYPPKFFSSDGHWVRSKAELVVDNWLYTKQLLHAYERRLPVPEEVYADFYIPVADCYIEYWGLDTEEYSERQKRKREVFDKYGLRVIELEEDDVTELDDRLPAALLQYLPEGYRFR